MFCVSFGFSSGVLCPRCRLYSFRFLQILMLEEKSSDVQHCQIDLSVDEEMKYGGGRK